VSESEIITTERTENTEFPFFSVRSVNSVVRIFLHTLLATPVKKRRTSFNHVQNIRRVLLFRLIRQRLFMHHKFLQQLGYYPGVFIA